MSCAASSCTSGLRVTQATLSRDLRELRLVKTSEGYKQLAQAAQESAEAPAISRLERAVKSFLTDIRPAQNMLVLKTPPGGAQPLAAAVDSEKWKEVSGTLAGDDTVLLICRRAPLGPRYKSESRECSDDRPPEGRRRRSHRLRGI